MSAAAPLVAALLLPLLGQGTDQQELVNALLAGLGFRETTGAELQREVAEIGGVPFKADVPLAFLSRDEMARYVAEVIDDEYPVPRAEADRRVLTGFSLLPPEADLRGLRRRLLQDSIVGFYDERPDRRRLYAVSADPRLTPSNQMILAHELRHALQDQYIGVHGVLPDSISDFDDRRIALLCLLEGDATVVTERFLARRLGTGERDLTGLTLPPPEMPGVPPVLRDGLVQPYLAGRGFVLALTAAGGWDAVQKAWFAPPQSTEQVLHPEKYGKEPPLPVQVGYAPAAGRLLAEGVLGELLVRTLLGDAAGLEASAGWGGDRYAAWDVGGRTLLVWRSRWDTQRDAVEFHAALVDRYAASHGRGALEPGIRVFRRDGWSVGLALDGDTVGLVSSDDAQAFEAARSALR